MAHGNAASNQREESESRADDVQARAAEARNDSPSSAIPIPRIVEDDESDLERGDDSTAPLISESQSPARSVWRNFASLSLSALSGEAAWRQAQADRNR